MNLDSPIFIAGHRGMVGSAILRNLEARGHTRLITRSRDHLNLLDQAAVNHFFAKSQIEYVFLAAAKVGGILANATYQADFLYENLMISANIIHAAAQNGVSKLLYLGSSCIYPKLAPQPISEKSLLTGPLETTNEVSLHDGANGEKREYNKVSRELKRDNKASREQTHEPVSASLRFCQDSS